MSVESGQKKLSELRVIELKAELEKRKIDQSGVKAVLIKKLQKALSDDGKNPETFLFDSDVKQSPAKKRKDIKVEGDEMTEVSAEQDVELKSDEKGDVEDVKNETGLNGEDEYEEMETENLQEDENDAVYEEIEYVVYDDTEDGNKKNLKVKKEREEEVKGEVESATLNEGEGEQKIVAEVEGVKKDLLPTKEEAKESDNTGKATPAKKTVIIRKIVKKTLVKQAQTVPQKKEKTVANTSQKVKKESIKEELKKEKPCVEDESVDEDEIIDLDELVDDEQINGMDNEDSINLNIGEEDTKFITEEAGLETEDKDSLERKAGKLERTKKPSDTSPRKGDKRHSQDKGEEDKEKSEHRNLWVSNLSSATRATDLKHLFLKYGKVVAAKIVTNAKTPGARCYGFVTMATKEDAAICIKALNVTELHGRLISVETVANKPTSNRKAEDRHKSSDRKSAHDEKKKRDEERSVSKEFRKEDSKERSRTRDRKEDPKRISRTASPRRRKEEPSPSRTSKSGVLTFQQIIQERERHRLREKERTLRDQERRTKEVQERQWDIERRNRDEAARLEREREKLKMERERIEKERSELLRLERDRLEREKEDLKRQQMKLEEARRLKRSLLREEYESSRKRPATDSRHCDARAPFETSHRSSSDYKKDVSRDRREVREVSPRRERFIERPHRREEVSRNKERFEQRGPSGGSRRQDVRRDDTLHRSKTDSQRVSHHSRPNDRFDSSSSSKGDRYGSSGDTWGSSSKGSSGFARSGEHSWSSSDLSRKTELAPWSRPPPTHSDRWANVSAMYPPVGSGMPSMSSMPMTASPYQMADRFDAYKQLPPISRKF